MNQIDNILEVAAQDLGYKEVPPNSNKTKFGEWYGLNGQPWCAIAINYWFNKAGLSHLFLGGLKSASCTEIMNWAKGHNQFHTSDFQRGDLALFDFDGDKRKSEHIGIIEQVNKDTVITIEGNTSMGNDSDGGEVMRRTRAKSLIIGAYSPAYKEDDEEMVKRYDAVAEIPAWGKPTIEKLIAKKFLKGRDNGKLDLTEDMLRIFVVNDAAGLYG